MLEHLLIDALKTRAAQTAKYNEALPGYQAVWDDPTRSDNWNLLLADSIWRELNRYKNVREQLANIASDTRVK